MPRPAPPLLNRLHLPRAIKGLHAPDLLDPALDGVALLGPALARFEPRALQVEGRVLVWQGAAGGERGGGVSVVVM